MKWLLHNRSYFSECGRYELRPAYADGHFSYRARLTATDELIASSADLGYVQQCCERHVDKLSTEAA